MSKILVTGATGFIGRRLIAALLDKGHQVFALSRIRGIDLKVTDHTNLRIIYGDLADLNSLEAIPHDVEAAFYLVHSMAGIVSNLVAEEEAIARNFLSIMEATSCRQIIYLGGIIEDEKELSEHLQARLVVEQVLASSRIPWTILRASIIVGAGSASFEIIRDLVEKLPLMVAPRWISSCCQPIAVADVLFYLCAVLLNSSCYKQIFDIGGPEVLTFKEVLLRFARFRGLRRHIFTVPVLTPRLSSYWLVFITSVELPICRYLIESMKHNTRKLNTSIDQTLPHQCLHFEKSLFLAFQKIQQNEVTSTWKDSWNIKSANADIRKFIEVPKEGCLRDHRVVKFDSSIEEVKERLWSLGGNQGWYTMNFAWRLRGLIDQMIGGPGLRRGRRHPKELQAGDALDFWRVLLADKAQGHLILFAEMKVPGEAWLEFRIDQTHHLLKQTATFRPRGLMGRLYWKLLWPIHSLIFTRLAKRLASK